MLHNTNFEPRRETSYIVHYNATYNTYKDVIKKYKDNHTNS